MHKVGKCAGSNPPQALFGYFKDSILYILPTLPLVCPLLFFMETYFCLFVKEVLILSLSSYKSLSFESPKHIFVLRNIYEAKFTNLLKRGL